MINQTMKQAVSFQHSFSALKKDDDKLKPNEFFGGFSVSLNLKSFTGKSLTHIVERRKS